LYHKFTDIKSITDFSILLFLLLRDWRLHVTITAEASHPTDIRVDIVLADHMHNLTGILLVMFVLELFRETLIS